MGIKLQLHGYPAGNYYTDSAGARLRAPARPRHRHRRLAADWPNGYGLLDELVDGNTITSGGNTNISELNDPVVNNLFTKANSRARRAPGTQSGPQIDQQVMKDAAILPEVYAKTLIYRRPNLTNVYVTDLCGMYNYAALGTTSKS